MSKKALETTNSKRSFSGNALIGVIVVTCVVLREYYATMYFSLAALVVFLIVLQVRTGLVFKYAVFLVTYATFFIGVYIAEASPQYLREVGVITGYTGSLQVFVLFLWLLFTFVWIIDPYIAKRFTRGNSGISSSGKNAKLEFIVEYGYIFVFILNIVLFLMVVRTPAFALGLSRFAYAHVYGSKFLSILEIASICLLPLVVAPHFRNPELPMRIIVVRLTMCYVPYVLYGVWTGNKFGLFAQMVFLLLIIFSDKVRKSSKAAFRVGIFLLASIVLLSITLVVYYGGQTSGGTNVILSITDRVNIQGEMWWRVFSESSNGSMHLHVWSDEYDAILDSIVTGGQHKDYGIYHLMKMYFPTSVYEEFYRIGARGTAAGFELPYYCFGYLGLVGYAFLTAISFALVINPLVIYLSEGKVLVPIACLRIMLLLLSAFMQGDWYLLFSRTAILLLALVTILVLINLNNKITGTKNADVQNAYK